jgi:hypothetical protein
MGKGRSMAGYYNDLHDNTKRNFVHIGIGEDWEFGQSNAGSRIPASD